MADRSLRPRSGSSAKALLLTILGEFALPHGGTIWTSTIIDGLGLLDIGERNARQAVARLSEQGIVDSERIGRRTRWHLTRSGRQLLETGAARIYEFGADTEAWDSHWLVVIASVPEDQRAKRHQLRSRLEFAGFGFITAGSAVSPHTEREPTANAILHELGLDNSAVVWIAETGSFVPDQEIIRRAWNLDALASRYDEFIGQFDERQPRSTESRFASLVELVHGWRRFPFSDPEIPSELLPKRWPGRSAKQLFDTRRASWGTFAQQWFVDAEVRGDQSPER
jgi:phenylacetic acid degradation operon negative regulatory protein